MAEYLPFWPKAAGIVYSAASSTNYLYTKALPTNGFTEVVAQLEIDAEIAGDGNTTITVTPEVSNDGINWQNLSGTFTFSPVTQSGGGTTYPVKEILKITTIASFMRFRIAIVQAAGSATNAGGPFMITGAGRS